MPINRRSLLIAAGITPMLTIRTFARLSAPVETANGRIRGQLGAGFQFFKNIPYAAPPTGANRFQPPQPVTSWAGVRDCTQYGFACKQTKWDDTLPLIRSWRGMAPESEDCLTLNVWTPAPDTAKRAVMVWIHFFGVTNTDGMRPFNDGANLCKKQDVVLVTINHRLNIFGYFHPKYTGLSQFSDSVNVGQRDLIAALQWIQDNIESFGGDPDRVMIFGQSGGGTKVGGLLTMPEASGLFHRAACQSVMGTPIDEATAQATANRVLKIAGLTKQTAGDLLNLTADQMVSISAQIEAETESGGSAKLYLVNDGDTLQGPAFDDDTDTISPLAANVPLLIGHTLTESINHAPRADFSMSWSDLQRKMTAEFTRGKVPNPARAIDGLRSYRPGVNPCGLYYEADTVLAKVRFDTIAAAKTADGAAAYRYALHWKTPAWKGKYHSPHMLDLPLVFDTIDNSASMISPGEKQARRVAKAMSGAWAAFAKTGNPSTPELSWTPYRSTGKRTMVFDLDSELLSDPYAQERAILADN